jgi:hypothetical protein
MSRPRRAKPKLALKDRLIFFAEETREKARRPRPGKEQDDPDGDKRFPLVVSP